MVGSCSHCVSASNGRNQKGKFAALCSEKANRSAKRFYGLDPNGMTSSPEARAGPSVRGFHCSAATRKGGGGWEGMDWPLLRFPQGTPLSDLSKTRLLCAATAPLGLSSPPNTPAKVPSAAGLRAWAEPATLHPDHRRQMCDQGLELLADMAHHARGHPQLSGRLDPPPTCKPVSLQQLNQPGPLGAGNHGTCELAPVQTSVSDFSRDFHGTGRPC